MTDHLHSFSSLCPIMFDYVYVPENDLPCKRLFTLYNWLQDWNLRFQALIAAAIALANHGKEQETDAKHSCSWSFYACFLVFLLILSIDFIFYGPSVSVSLSGWILQGWVGAVLLSADGLNMDGFWRCILLVQLCH